jgi:hypothetical protein
MQIQGAWTARVGRPLFLYFYLLKHRVRGNLAIHREQL